MSRGHTAIILASLMLMISWSSLTVPADSSSDGDGVEIEWLRLEPDPNSIRGIEPAEAVEGSEKIRETTSLTRLGLYDINGLRLEQSLPESFTAPRTDLVLVLVDGEVGLWDAQISLAEISGLTIQAYIPPSGFLVQGDIASLAQIANLSPIVAVHPVPAALVVADELLDASALDTQLVRIQGWRDADSGTPTAEIRIGSEIHNTEELAKQVLRESHQVDTGRIEGIISISELPNVALDPAVSWIRLAPQFELHNDRARQHMQTATAVTAFGTTLNGSGQIVAVADSGIDQDHGDMDNRIVGAVSVVNGDSSTEDVHEGHGTHVACTVLGDGTRGGYAGVAPEAELYFQAMERDSDGQFYSPSMNYMLNTAYDNYAYTHTNSWGSQQNYGEYTTDSQDVDDRVNYYDQIWSYNGMTVLFSAGNDGNGAGTITPPATAKNQIAVANHHNRGGGAPDTLATSSSRGPTDDGRLKPDITAPGTWVRSCKSQDANPSGSSWSSQWYMEYSGTSMAAPNAAGSSALIREYLTEVAQRPEPQGALVKGLLILGAEDMGTRNIPNNDEGWGRLNLARSLTVIGDTGVWVDDRNYLRSGQSRDYTFNLSHGWQQFKVVLTWSDYRGSTWASSQLQNDLDLEVTAPDGTTTYLGNVFENGRSATGGDADDVNNVEVVLIDQAQKGIWNVRVIDSRHGGQKSEQTYSLAIRGAGVDDLSPDAAFVANSFSLSDPIPQVNEEVTFNVQVTNMGSRIMEDLVVKATAGSQQLGTQLVTLGPGEVRGLNWQWTPTANGDQDIIIRLDPDDTFEELDEANNMLLQTVGITEPGVRLVADDVVKWVSEAETSTTQWNLTLKNTALLPTNASVSVTKPIRLSDGQQFDSWFQSFSQTTFAMNGSEQIAVGLTLVHPTPPDPGIYRFTVTGTDVDNQIDYPITLTLDVPVLPALRFTKAFSELSVSPVENSSFEVTLLNEGNGAQGWDLTLDAPSGWHLGFDNLGSTPGAPAASSGYLPMDGSRTVSITMEPPENLVASDTHMSGTLTAVSQLDSDKSWVLPLDFVVAKHRAGSLINESSYGQLRPDSQLNLRFLVTNEGNAPMILTPDVELPGGWSVTNNLPDMTVAASDSMSLVVGIHGNGRATSGPIQFEMIEQDGWRMEWSGYLDVQNTPQPRLSFSEIVQPDGTTADSPLGAGDHQVGPPGIHLIWFIANEGSQSWTPSTNLILPSSAWMGLCDSIGEIEPGSGDEIDCLVIIPAGTVAGTQPQVTLDVAIDEISISDTISLRVAPTRKVTWSEPVFAEDLVEGVTTTFTIDVANTGNSPLSHRLETSAPSGWIVDVTSHQMLELQPGEERTLSVEVTPTSAGNTSISIRLANADDVEGADNSVTLAVADDPSKEPSSGVSGVVWAGVIIILLALIGGVVFIVMPRGRQQENGSVVLPPPPMMEPNLDPAFAPAQPQAVTVSKAPAPKKRAKLPLPPPPKSQPAKAPSADQFEPVEDESAEPQSDVESEVVEQSEEPSENEGQSRQKCWVCLESLVGGAWQACPQCGALYHLSSGGCQVDSLTACRNCSGSTDDFVRVGG